MLLKNSEISVTEEKKGKQIAVKENNITSLKKFYKDNSKKFESNREEPQQVITPMANEELKVSENSMNNLQSASPTTNSVSIEGQNESPVSMISTPNVDNILKSEENIAAINPIDIVVPTIETPVVEQTPIVENKVEENSSDNSNTGDSPIINLVPETNPELTIEEEMDPELKEIKERLDKVILDLNNYKKKIKILEDKVNQNLEKSKEVLKDTQAAAQIISIQQERQRQINEDSGGTSLETDSSRILQKVS